VLRREMRMMESGPFSTDLVERSKTLLERQPFVEDVTIETPKVDGSDDLVDVEVKVKERNAGTFNAGFGYSDFYGLQFTAGISHENFLGSGNRVAFSVSNSKAIKNYDVSFTDPYFTVDGISLTVNDVSDNGFSVSIIPHTAKVTTLGLKQVNDPVNLESDLIGKYVERLLQERGQLPKPTISIDKDYLQKRGLI